MFVANFVVQLDNFWTARRYFKKLYFINVCVKVCLILVFSFCRLNICCLILSLAQTQNLKLFFIFFVGHRSAQIDHPIRFSMSGTSKFSEARKVAGKTRKEVTSYEGKEAFLRRTLSCGSQNVIGVFSDRGRRATNWLGPWKVPRNYGCCWKGMPFAKLPCQNRKYNYQIYWTQFYQGNNFYDNYNKK